MTCCLFKVCCPNEEEEKATPNPIVKGDIHKWHISNISNDVLLYNISISKFMHDLFELNRNPTGCPKRTLSFWRLISLV